MNGVECKGLNHFPRWATALQRGSRRGCGQDYGEKNNHSQKLWFQLHIPLTTTSYEKRVGVKLNNEVGSKLNNLQSIKNVRLKGRGGRMGKWCISFSTKWFHFFFWHSGVPCNAQNRKDCRIRGVKYELQGLMAGIPEKSITVKNISCYR